MLPVPPPKMDRGRRFLKRLMPDVDRLLDRCKRWGPAAVEGRPF